MKGISFFIEFDIQFLNTVVTISTGSFKLKIKGWFDKTEKLARLYQVLTEIIHNIELFTEQKRR